MSTASDLPSDVKESIANGGVAQLDERGLMPISEARKTLEGLTEFRRGRGQIIGGSMVWDSDRQWAALMSLENVDEFLKYAMAIEWYFHPRGNGTHAPFSRYGEGILPWLKKFLRPDGHFRNVPWCVLSCLFMIDKEEVFDLM